MKARLLAVLALAALALWPLPSRAESVDMGAVAADIAARGAALLEAYRPADAAETAAAFSDLYFDVFEGSGMEAALGAKDPELKTELESRFAALIGLAAEGAPRERVAPALDDLSRRLAEAARLNGEVGGGLAVMIQSFLILLREGFEAILVVGALTAYLRRIGAEAQIRVVGRAILLALVASAATAAAMMWLIEISGPAREGLEGGVMLIAAAVLVYVSHWLFARREAARWQDYIRQQVDQAVSGGQSFTLGLAAFLAVYREGAETVLFYQALLAGSPGQAIPAAVGFGAAAIALGGLYWGYRAVSARLPLKPFFAGTALLLYGLAVVFAGQGVLELQEARWIGITVLDWAPRIPWMGVFPTVETLAAQGVVLLLLLPPLIGRLRAQRAGA
ncbi:MAG: FTR1 family iron permease [Alphaproteobacteria bacterium]|nr:FTR1 family iron permease [Alphaproteobacteria bacterium]